MGPVLIKRQSNDAERGASLVLILPVVLVLAVVALLFLSLVQSAGQTQFEQGMSVKARYAAQAVLQVSLLEIQPRTYLAEGAYASDETILVVDEDALPRRGTLLIAGAVPAGPYAYRRTSEGELRLEEALTSKLPPGSVIYLCQDIDGNGSFGTIGETTFAGATVSSSFAEPHRSTSAFPEDVATVYMQAQARLGNALAVLDTAQSFDE